MQRKLPTPDAALADQMDWLRGAFTSPLGVFGSVRLIEGWKLASGTIALEHMLWRSVEQGPQLFRDLRPQDRSGRARMERHFHTLRNLLSRASPHLEYSPLLSRLIRIAHELGVDSQPLTSPSASWLPPQGQAKPGFVPQTVVYDELLNRVAAEGCLQPVKVECRRWRQQADDDFRSASTYLDAMLRAESSLFVLRMNLGEWGALLQDPPGFPIIGDVQEFKARFKPFAKELSRGAQGAIAGYFVRLDFAPEKGFFFHLVVLLRASEAPRAAYWCEQLGQRWVDMCPPGRGAYTGCNWVFQDPAASIGLIHADSKADRVAMERWVIAYLTLTSRYSRVRLNARQRVFSRGSLPKETS